MTPSENDFLQDKAKNTVYIALGSNKGNKLNFLQKAVENINADNKCKVEICSSVYETKAFRNLNQQNFLNAVIKISTEYNPAELFNFLKEIEKEIGRRENEKWGDREIDLDILFYNDIIFQDERITVPHKGIIQRDFVLIPLCEIAPYLIHPELNQKICDIRVEDSEKCVLKKLSEKLTIEKNIE
jgi:2-amino-4-hydroxy-6-hydroxymethyldihydropteridine diphosphokinase